MRPCVFLSEAKKSGGKIFLKLLESLEKTGGASSNSLSF